ncbi:hypothetical protein P7H50_13265 [Enterococcus durans]|uniref:hypothetical protein n=1 Tax=Enterococcus durans TaxID=53345 RepID=UPI0028908349|nr:hypothetical protein [Enterococcus durans]MDT2837830.1 hypothetical protein [Enterococcus durans]
MVFYKNHEKNVVYYNAMIASTKNYEFSKKKMEELKSQVTREVYRNLKTWSERDRLKTQLAAIQKEIYVGPESNLETMQEEIYGESVLESQLEAMQEDSETESILEAQLAAIREGSIWETQQRNKKYLKNYLKTLKKKNAEDNQSKLENIDKQLAEIKKVYIEKKKIEKQLSEYPFKEKYGKKSTEIKQLIWEKQAKEEKLRELCGTSHPFTKKGKAQLNVPSNLYQANELDKGEAEQKDFVLVPKKGLWAKKQNHRYNKETNIYTNYVNERKFTKITDEALQGNPLVMCINNENPKLIPFEDEYSVMARSYQNLYDECLTIDKKLLSVPEVKSKIQRHIIDYFTETIDRYSPYDDPYEMRWAWVRVPIGYSRKIQRDEYLGTWECATVYTYDYRLKFNDRSYINDLHQFLLTERTGYTELRDSTLHFLKKYEQQLKTETNELKQQLTPAAYSKFKENFQGFSDLIGQVKKHPYLDLKPFLNDLLEKNKDALVPKIAQINNYRDEAIRLYRKKKELEKKLNTFPYSKSSNEYNLVKTEKTQVEMRLKALCGTTSPFTDKGKQMMYFHSKEEQNKSSHVLSEPNFSATNMKLLKDRMDQAKEKRKNVSETKDIGRRRTEPEAIIIHI